MIASIYDDDALVGELTRDAFQKTDSRLLQIHRFADSDWRHAAELLKIFNPKQAATIADVGCGVGALAELMRATRPDLNFVLINKSREQLDMCPPSFRLIQGVAEALPLEPGAVDAIMVTYVLGHVDLERFISECRRVLEPGDHVYVYDLFKTHQGKPCRIETDLQYAERTVDELVDAFVTAGFKKSQPARYSYFAPKKIAALMPGTDTLENAVSAALVFQL